MIRDKLFRAKRFDNGEWVYGSLTHYNEFLNEPEDEIFNTLYYIVDARNKQYLVITETVGQFTGETDKHDVKIFDGDMVVDTAWKKENPQVISWGKQFRVSFTDGYGQVHYEHISKVKHRFEIVGNVHDAI
jgi:hypothetical protein